MRYANGVDLRDLYRRGSGLTPRRLWVLFRMLPDHSTTWGELRLAEEKAKIPTVDKIKERQEYWRSRGN